MLKLRFLIIHFTDSSQEIKIDHITYSKNLYFMITRKKNQMYSISKPMNQSQAHNTTKLLDTDNKAQKQVNERAILKPFL